MFLTFQEKNRTLSLEINLIDISSYRSPSRPLSLTEKLQNEREKKSAAASR